MYTVNQIIDLLKDKFDYKKIVNDKKFIGDVKRNSSEFNVFIPVRNRKRHIIACAQYMRYSAAKYKIPVSIVLIENDVEPQLKEIYKEIGCDYIFIPSDVTKTEGYFAKPLCYNTGFLMANESYWSIFHDADILVEEDYFYKLRIHLNKNPNWLQPYTRRRVIMVQEGASKIIMDNPGKIMQLNEIREAYAAQPGSPGGSIVVKSSDFKKISGYDNAIFNAYSPEDAFFWLKLEFLYRKEKVPLRVLFEGGASYADDPPMEIYHLYHPPQWANNPSHSKMLDIYSSFLNFSYDDQEKVFKTIQNNQKLSF